MLDILESEINLQPKLKNALLRLATPFPEGLLLSLSQAVGDYGESILKAAKAAAFIDVPLALSVCSMAQEILKRYDSYDPPSQRLGAGAVKYFLLRDDEINGFTTPGGFEDDAMVMKETMRLLALRHPQTVDENLSG